LCELLDLVIRERSNVPGLRIANVAAASTVRGLRSRTLVIAEIANYSRREEPCTAFVLAHPFPNRLAQVLLHLRISNLVETVEHDHSMTAFE
jgi:hypothetical protein